MNKILKFFLWIIILGVVGVCSFYVGDIVAENYFGVGDVSDDDLRNDDFVNENNAKRSLALRLVFWFGFAIVFLILIYCFSLLREYFQKKYVRDNLTNMVNNQ